jgi:secreted PhoX family phosphatase
MRFFLNGLARVLGTSVVAAACVAACGGEKGDQGPAGPAGANAGTVSPGEPGANGSNGAKGDTGAQGPAGPAGKRRSIQFASVMAPTTDADKRLVLGSTKAVVDGDAYALSFHTELRSGQTLGKNVFGRIVDKAGAPVKNADGSELVSPSNDFSSILPVGNKLFEVTHFETTPAAMYLTELAQDASGKLTPTSTKPLDFSSVNGLWIPCAGSVSPWGTHLGSEEYPSDARIWEGAATLSEVGGGNMIRYFGLDPSTATVAAAKAVYNPYNYGYVTEVALTEAGSATITKHYAAGRRALELAYVMPDRKTVYLTDDGTNDAFYMFVAKNAGDLSEGRLFAARWFQTSPNGQGNGKADIDWIELGPSAKDADVRALIDGGITFSKIFDTEVPNADGTCPSAASGFKSTVVDVAYAVKTECLKLKPGQELAASRLESRRYAAYVGATTEFRKNEGITFNPDANRLYVAFSEVNNGAIDAHPTRDLGGPNHVRLAENPCGAVYEYSLAPSASLGSDYVAQAASSLLEGTWLANPAAPNPYPASNPYAGSNTCSVNAIANPDNLSYMPGFDTLLIGEDSGVEHQNDAVWAYNVTTRELTRILTTPYGAETTGVYFYPNLNGHAYVKVQVQHPYGESDQAKKQSDDDLRSYTGYLGPLPAMN